VEDAGVNAIRERPDRRHAARRAGSSPRDEQERRSTDRRVARLRRPLEVDPAAVRTARRVLLLSALIVAPVDLVDKAATSTLPSAYHARGLGGALAMAAMVVVGAWFFPRAGSRLIAVAGGLMVGGGIANVLSLGIWGRGVPNPLLSERLGIAYNLADVAIGLGLLSMFAATLIFAVQHRGELGARL
jgi:hypothetical protein